MDEYFDFEPEDEVTPADPWAAATPQGAARTPGTDEVPTTAAPGAYPGAHDAAATWATPPAGTPPFGTPPGGTPPGGTPPGGTPPGGTPPGGTPPYTPAPAHGPRGGRLAAIVASVAALALAAGSIGYLLGNHGSPQVSHGFTLPFGGDGEGDGPSGSSGFGGFGLPNFGQLPGGQSSSSTAPKAVASEEKALVDVDTTIDNGRASGAGTGIVLTSSGIVLTNNHVVDGATSISVTDLGNGQTYGATVLGYDVRDDVAVIQLTNASGLTTAALGQPATVGQTVYAVGNAGGVGGTPTVTSGTITGVGKSVTASDSFDGTSETLHGMLQTSAALISGDSGGALMTASGTVVGVNTAGSSGSGGGFAIPIAKAHSIALQIESGAATARVHVGPTAMLGVEIKSSTGTTGAPVSGVLPNTPAANAGITAGSRITSVGSVTIADGNALRLAMTGFSAGSSVRVTWVDAHGTHHSATVTLESGPPQ